MTNIICLKLKKTHPLCDFVNFVIQEIILLVEMLFAKHALSYNAIRHSAFYLHHQFQHFVVGLARKHYSASVELKEGAADGP